MRRILQHPMMWIAHAFEQKSTPETQACGYQWRLYGEGCLQHGYMTAKQKCVFTQYTLLRYMHRISESKLSRLSV